MDELHPLIGDDITQKYNYNFNYVAIMYIEHLASCLV